jgi:hypothetical protein
VTVVMIAFNNFKHAAFGPSAGKNSSKGDVGNNESSVISNDN